MGYKYISFARILREPVDIKRALEVTRKWLMRSNIRMGFYITHEISPKGLPHIHALLIVNGDENKWALFNYVKTHQLCSYIDDVIQIQTYTEAKYFYKYIKKQQPKNAEIFKDYLINNLFGFRFNQDLETDILKNKELIKENDIFIDN